MTGKKWRSAKAIEFQVDWFLERLDVQNWSLATGLIELAARGRVALSIRGPEGCSAPGDWFEVRRAGEPAVRIYFDGSDGASLASPERAHRADVVWKRSFLEEVHDQKVVPFGYSLACCPPSGLPRISILSSRCRAVLRGQMSPRTAAGSVRDAFRPPFESLLDFEHPPVEGNGQVFFQVKAWSPTDTMAKDRESINLERAEIIRLGRKELGDRFVGGFLPTPFARERYPNLLTDRPTDQLSFLQSVKHSSVVIGSSGLHRSNPHKLAEYLAASRPMVIQEPFYAVPEPLAAGKNFREYQDPQSCIQATQDLLQDSGVRSAMRHQNAQLWREAVRPDALLWRRLTELVGHF